MPMSSAAQLRWELAERAALYARLRSLPHCVSYGQEKVICFEPYGDGLHGNFYPSSYKAARTNPEWRRRLVKVHTTARRSLPLPDNGRRRELDSCVSSDALLMNVFCHPSVLRRARVMQLLGIELGPAPQFGFRARVPLMRDRFDQTEADMRVGNLLVEAKLTESDFQRVAKTRLRLYRDFLAVFDAEGLPQTCEHFCSYQLIRNVLAAYSRQCSFCVLLDARRPDLIEAWYAVMKCIRPVELRIACKVLTWQELSGALPASLQAFLAEKYGIEKS
jgi:hypothetical protein